MLQFSSKNKLKIKKNLKTLKNMNLERETLKMGKCSASKSYPMSITSTVFISLGNELMIRLKIEVFLYQPDILHPSEGFFTLAKGPSPWRRHVSSFCIIFLRLGEDRLHLGEGFTATKAGFALANQKFRLQILPSSLQ